MEEHGTWLHWLYVLKIFPEWLPEMVAVTYFVVLVLSVIAIVASRRLRPRHPSRFQAFIEYIVTALDGFVANIVGEEQARSLTPVIGTIFIFIFCLNIVGLIPGFVSPTANINTTVALAVFAFFLVQFYGIRSQGFSYLRHFWGDPWWLGFLMFPIHVIGELARPLSLSIRLFGNIFGEDMVIAILILIVMNLVGKVVPEPALAFLPAQFPMMLFALFTSFVQALVFSMLVCIYIVVAVGGHEEH